jgi:predicted AAA+ superfamily ATPase
MEELIEQSRRRVERVPDVFVRGIHSRILWDSRLIGIRGARGAGKTTLLLQQMKSVFRENPGKALYVALDNLWFTKNDLPGLADSFYKKGGNALFLDEVHRYPDWPRVLKQIYDDYPDLSIVFTGSSLLHILDSRADLSRRALVYDIQGLSFREYLNLKLGSSFAQYSLEEILRNHETIAGEINKSIKPFEYFDEYLKTGYYPYFMEGIEAYPMRLEETVSMILEIELPQLRQVQVSYIPKLRQLLGIIS